MRISKSSTTMAVAALLVAFASGSPAAVGVPPSDIANGSSSDETKRDLDVLAEALGISVDEADRRFSGQEAFYEALEQVRHLDPDAVVRAEWNDGSGLIYVQPFFAEQARTIASASDIQIRQVDQIGEATQDDVVSAISRTLSEQGQSSFVTTYDWETNSVRVETFGTAVIGEESLWSLSSVPHGFGVSVQIVESAVEAAPEPAARGGMAYSNCTGGFIVKSGSSRYIATAHHCTSRPTTYDGATTGSSVIASSFDIRRTQLSGSHGATFRRDIGVYSTVTSYGNPAFGGYVCKFGTTTHLTCSQVNATGQCVKYSGWPQFCGIFRTISDMVDPGDSGGPAFNGSRALGLVSGHSQGVTSYFSQISTLSGLGVTVVTG